MKLVQDDYVNRLGKWVQRGWVGEKYTWTVSGVAWNNIKERCTVGGATQSREDTYVGCINSFKGFQNFANWHVEQAGYGLGYQVDADILRGDVKEYSEDTCLLLPSALNKFLQSTEGKRGIYPQGVQKSNGLFFVHINNAGIGHGHKNILDAREAYRVAKNGEANKWYIELQTKKYEVDPRATEYMRNWRHDCKWVEV